ncbi:MAG: PhzF family phenazine biosynthesis protein [Dehalococcoidia bacterium]
MRYRFLTCDVFTRSRFGGNQLAVLPDARGLTDAQMQQVAREFNFSETTFVLPAEAGHTRRVRIFTPMAEMPFAGHPNVGTAFTLASTGELGPTDGPQTVTFEEEAGLVPIRIEPREASVWCELEAPQRAAVGDEADRELAAAAVSLAPTDLAESSVPQVASAGLPFLFIELRDRDALARAHPAIEALRGLEDRGLPSKVHVFVREPGAADVYARMFAPLTGVPEDAATGSAACALAGLLASRAPEATGTLRWTIHQGLEMGRPSLLEARAEKHDGAVVTTAVGGYSVLVSEGTIEVD